MVSIGWSRIVIAGSLALCLSVLQVAAARAGTDQEKGKLPEGVYLELTEDFYRALRDEAGGTRSLRTDLSEEYLRQIAVSAKFMVESNLQILRQQERIIRLLERRRDAE